MIYRSNIPSIINDLKDTTDFFTAVGTEMQAQVKENFILRQSKWKPLSPLTRPNVGNRRILIASDDLRKNILYESTAKSATVGISDIVPYGVYHQYGEGVPKREFADLDTNQQANLADFMGKLLRDMLSQNV